jgi:hypothetical protein
MLSSCDTHWSLSMASRVQRESSSWLVWRQTERALPQATKHAYRRYTYSLPTKNRNGLIKFTSKSLHESHIAKRGCLNMFKRRGFRSSQCKIGIPRIESSFILETLANILTRAMMNRRRSNVQYDIVWLFLASRIFGSRAHIRLAGTNTKMAQSVQIR